MVLCWCKHIVNTNVFLLKKMLPNTSFLDVFKLFERDLIASSTFSWRTTRTGCIKAWRYPRFATQQLWINKTWWVLFLAHKFFNTQTSLHTACEELFLLLAWRGEPIAGPSPWGFTVATVEIYVGSAQRSQSFSEPPCKDLPQEKLPGPEGGLVHQLTKFWVDNNSIESRLRPSLGQPKSPLQARPRKISMAQK